MKFLRIAFPIEHLGLLISQTEAYLRPYQTCMTYVLYQTCMTYVLYKNNQRLLLIVYHCVKGVRVCSSSSPYFPTFVSLRIQSECGKTRTRTTPNMDLYHAVYYAEKFYRGCLRGSQMEILSLSDNYSHQMCKTKITVIVRMTAVYS